MRDRPGIDEGLDALMQTVLDGEADAATRARLEAKLTEDAELRAHFEKLQVTFGALEEISIDETPAEIRRTVMGQVTATRAPASLRRTPRPRFGGKREWVAFFAGAAAAALVFVLNPSVRSVEGPSPFDASGTLLSRNSGEPTLFADTWTWSESWGSGEAELRMNGARAVLDLRFRGEGPTTVSLAFDPEAWEIAELGAAASIRSMRWEGEEKLTLGFGGRDHIAIALTPVGSPDNPPALELRIETPQGSETTRLGGEQ